MKLHAIRALHKSMLEKELDIQKFDVTIGSGHFECLFSTREEPFMLSLTSSGRWPVQFVFPVVPGYWVKAHFGEQYGQLRKTLGKGWPKGKKVTPTEFFELLEEQVPASASKAAVPEPADILRLRHDLEDMDKPYFDAWVFWDKEDDKGPSEANLKKTLLLMGNKAYRYSKKKNASSRWRSKAPKSERKKSPEKHPENTYNDSIKSYQLEFVGQEKQDGTRSKTILRCDSAKKVSNEDMFDLFQQALVYWIRNTEQGSESWTPEFTINEVARLQKKASLKDAMKRFGIKDFHIRILEADVAWSVEHPVVAHNKVADVVDHND